MAISKIALSQIALISNYYSTNYLDVKAIGFAAPVVSSKAECCILKSCNKPI